MVAIDPIHFPVTAPVARYTVNPSTNRFDVVPSSRPAWLKPAASAQATDAVAAVPAAPPSEPDGLRFLFDHGFSLFPLIGNTKRPAVKWARYETERATWPEVAGWRATGRTSFAVATGAVSGVVVLDLDSPEAEAEAERRGLPATWTVRTPRGRHVYFRHSEAHPVRNTVALPGMFGADVRGGGGYVVGAGSRFVPDAGETASSKVAGIYHWENAPGDCELASPPAWLLEMLAEKVALKAPPAPSLTATVRPAADASAWALAALEAEASKLAMVAEGRRNNALNNAALSLGRIVAGGHLSRLVIIDRLTAVALKIGMDATEILPTIESGLTKGLEQPRHPPEQEAFAAGGHGAAASTDFRPLDMSVIREVRQAAPRFPIEAFAPTWAGWIADEARGAGAPPDYTAVALIVVAASAIGNARRVSVTSTWSEPSIIWALAIGAPSTGKTQALKPAIKLVEPIACAMAVAFETTFANYTEQTMLATLADEDWLRQAKAATKEGRDPPPRPASAYPPPRPVCPTPMVMDSTPEKIISIQASMPKGFMLFRDEAAGWLGGMNRYGGDGDRAMWLEAYNGGRHQVDRQKLDRPTVVPRFAVSALGGMQPERFAELMAKDPDDGLVARFLMAFPDPLPALPLARDVPSPVWPAEAIKRLYDLELAKREGGALEPIVVPLSHAATAMFDLWQVAHKSEHVEGLAEGHWGKMSGLALRLSLVLAYLDWATSGGAHEPVEISEGAVASAILLLDTYFKPCALRLYGDADTSAEGRATVALARWLSRTRPPKFNQRAAQRAGVGLPAMLKRSGKAMQEACDGLLDAGWLLAIGASSGGRAPKDYRVNPAIWDALGRL